MPREQPKKWQKKKKKKRLSRTEQGRHELQGKVEGHEELEHSRGHVTSSGMRRTSIYLRLKVIIVSSRSGGRDISYSSQDVNSFGFLLWLRRFRIWRCHSSGSCCWWCLFNPWPGWDFFGRRCGKKKKNLFNKKALSFRIPLVTGIMTDYTIAQARNGTGRF